MLDESQNDTRLPFLSKFAKHSETLVLPELEYDDTLGCNIMVETSKSNKKTPFVESAIGVAGAETTTSTDTYAIKMAEYGYKDNDTVIVDADDTDTDKD